MSKERVFKIRPAPVRITRSFATPQKRLWEAWSDESTLRRWFAPAGFTIASIDADFRVGGVFSIRLQAVGGYEFVSHGTYSEIVEPDRLAFHSRDSKFSSETRVSFTEDGSGTLLSIEQDYEVYAPGFMAVVAGAPEAWRTTLDKLEIAMETMAV